VRLRQQQRVVSTERGWPRALAFAPDGKTLLAAAAMDGAAVQVASGRQTGALEGHRDEVLAVAFGRAGWRRRPGEDARRCCGTWPRPPWGA